MSSGGSRPGAGRKRSGPDSVQVTWRVSENAKKWIVDQAKKQGISVSKVVDALIGMSIGKVASSVSNMEASCKDASAAFQTIGETMRALPEEVLNDF